MSNKEVLMKKACKVLLIIAIVGFALLIAFNLFDGVVHIGEETSAGFNGNTNLLIRVITALVMIVPLMFNIEALKKLKKAQTKSELTVISVLLLIFGNFIVGLLMLIMKDEDLKRG